jgi:hypothetical protein
MERSPDARNTIRRAGWETGGGLRYNAVSHGDILARVFERPITLDLRMGQEGTAEDNK